MNHREIADSLGRFPDAHRRRIEPEGRDFLGQRQNIANGEVIPLDLVVTAAPRGGGPVEARLPPCGELARGRVCSPAARPAQQRHPASPVTSAQLESMLESRAPQLPEQTAIRAAVLLARRSVFGNHGPAQFIDVRAAGQNSLAALAHDDPYFALGQRLLHRGQRRREQQRIADVAKFDEKKAHRPGVFPDLPEPDAEKDESFGLALVVRIPRCEVASVAVSFRSERVDQLPRLARLEHGGDSAFDDRIRIKRRDGFRRRRPDLAARLDRRDKILRDCGNCKRQEEKGGYSAAHERKFKGTRTRGNTENGLAMRGARKRT